MSCCSSTPKGAAPRGGVQPGRSGAQETRLGARPNASGVSSGAATLPLRYVGTSAVRVYGPFTHQHYDFRPGQVGEVDARDAATFLRHALFRRA